MSYGLEKAIIHFVGTPNCYRLLQSYHKACGIRTVYSRFANFKKNVCFMY